MSLDNQFFYTIEPESLKKIWENYSKRINGKFDFKELIRAHVNGPFYTYKIHSELERYELIIKQTVYIIPGGNDRPTLQEYTLSKETNEKIYFRIWKKGFFEKIVGLNKVNTGNSEIDRKFSLKTNCRKLEELFKQNEMLREMLTSSNYHFLMETRNRVLNITLKRMGIVKSEKDFEKDIEILRLILNKMK
ncbi:MAG: hypothetical protein GQ564_19415 [Bacteroidales bacterium]|nr:hypothetical protein [Bacteroidales bacterium]